MTPQPTHLTVLQAAVTLIASLMFAGAFWMELRNAGIRAAAGKPATTPPVSGLVGVGTVLVALLLVSRGVDARQISLPMADYFDAFLLLSLLLAALWSWFAWTSHLKAMATFLLPMIALLILLGGVLEMTGYHHFQSHNPWIIVHIISVLSGTVFFAIGCVGGFVYLLADWRLRTHQRSGWTMMPLPSLATLEKFNRNAILLGFPLLTIAAVTGIFRAVQDPAAMGTHWFLTAKFILASLVWLVYVALLGVRLAPALRGSRAAMLNILGFALLLAVFVAIKWMPGK